MSGKPDLITGAVSIFCLVTSCLSSDCSIRNTGTVNSLIEQNHFLRRDVSYKFELLHLHVELGLGPVVCWVSAIKE